MSLRVTAIKACTKLTMKVAEHTRAAAVEWLAHLLAVRKALGSIIPGRPKRVRLCDVDHEAAV